MLLYDILVNIAYILFSVIFRFKVIGKENIPLDGKLIVCSNHKNNLDPVIISIFFSRQICWMAKKEIFNNKLINFIARKVGAFPVNRDEVDIGAVKNALKILKEDRVLGIFPEGTRVKKMDLNNAKSGVSLLAIKSKSPVLPIYIESNYKLFSKIIIHIGEPLYLYKDIEGKLTPEQYSDLSKHILSQIYSLKYEGGK
nr:lysophospholipid acyltransferase family protein [Tissierella creatinophila]